MQLRATFARYHNICEPSFPFVFHSVRFRFYEAHRTSSSRRRRRNDDDDDERSEWDRIRREVIWRDARRALSPTRNPTVPQRQNFERIRAYSCVVNRIETTRCCALPCQISFQTGQLISRQAWCLRDGERPRFIERHTVSVYIFHGSFWHARRNEIVTRVAVNYIHFRVNNLISLRCRWVFSLQLYFLCHFRKKWQHKDHAF